MRKRIVRDASESRLLSVDELQQYLSVGRSSAVNLGNAAGAAVNIGRRKLYDRQKIDTYIEEALLQEHA